MIKHKNYARFPEVVELPNLVEIQTFSYENFHQQDVARTRRQDRGLQAVFNDIFPITAYDGSARLEFVSYSIGRSKYSVEECRQRGMTYAAPLKLKLRLVRKTDSKEEDVYIGDLPLMTSTGTFIINGAERVIVSQLHRSPGVSFEQTVHSSGKRVYSARVIPYRGAWLELEIDINDTMFIYIDRRWKFLATTLLKALGYSDSKEIINIFYGVETLRVDSLRIIDSGSRANRTLADNIVDKKNGKSVARVGEKISKDLLKELRALKIKTVRVLKEPIRDFSIANTLARDTSGSTEEALMHIYRHMRPGDPATKENSEALIKRLFLDPQRYNLGRVGRHILNRKLGLDASLDKRTLELNDFIVTIQHLIKLKNGEFKVDDIDHLGNRRIRSVGELLQNQFRMGLARMERSVLERMSIYDLASTMPHNLINAKLISAVVRDFFGRSQLSQFMDQINPLAELTHKRRLSALGPGGLSRERAGFEVRDVHYSHYGRICPIETPEGANIGLISSLSTYAKVNEFGFLETPYRKVIKGKATDKIEYLSADMEEHYAVAQANTRLNKTNKFIEDVIFCRYRDDFVRVARNKVDYMDVSPKQLVGVAASLIPFLEHDDANRALMGSNMQRQAVPLLISEPPLVGTGMEKRVAIDSGRAMVAQKKGTVKEVTAERIIIDDQEYQLTKFARSNASTHINQRPIVSIGDKVQKGQVIADGAAISQGELSLGRNILVAFMPWRGYNFEDAIVVSEKLVKEDTYTSVHIEEFEIEARDTKLGSEEITCDIPNVGEEALRHLDKEGIARIGAEVGPGDILAGKVTPKSETELSPEEKLLRAIFGEKAGDVRDASLTVPPGIQGIVINTRTFSRKGTESQTKEEKKAELSQVDKIRGEYKKRISRISQEKFQKISDLLIGKKLKTALFDETTGGVLIPKGKQINNAKMAKLKKCDFQNLRLKDYPEIEKEIRKIARISDDSIEELIEEEEKEVEYLKKGDELPPGVIKKVVVHVATKRKLSVGDKMAGRHGNKGVVSKIVPEEDMPFLPDGTPVEMVLNPLGVPSRMNVGQILEAHLGWAAKTSNFCAITPVFEGASEEQIRNELKQAGLPQSGQITLYDGRTGESFEQEVTVGYIYMMKLSHLVDDKIHARSIGPYSLVTQQPLGGKAQFGGQRFGEMEVWALEAYGAAYCLQELLTVKSDDVIGRTKIYEAIVKGENALRPGTPESFNVLVKELQGLALDIIVEKTEREKREKKK